VARELFLDREGYRERQNPEREIKVFAGFGAFSCPKIAQDTGLRRGQKLPRECQNISRGGSCPLLPAPMVELYKKIGNR